MSAPLDAQELEALMQAIESGRVAPTTADAARGPVVPYDLTNQDRIIRGQMPTLDAINDRIASLYAKNLSARLRVELRATAAPATLLKFSDFYAQLVPGATIGMLGLGAGHGLALLVLEQDLALALLAAALGDRKGRSGQAEEARRELTNVERVVLRHLSGVLTEAMTVGWAEVMELKPELLRFEADPRMTLIATPSDVAILCPFELTGALEGRLQVAIPYAAVEPAKKLLSSSPRAGGQQRDARFSAAFGRELESVEVELRVEIGRRRLSLQELLGLEVGHLLTLNTNESTALPVFVQGRPKMTAAPRVVGGGMAIEILRSVDAGGAMNALNALKKDAGAPKRPGGSAAA
jgi:flagellar motor switch protein FliM